MSESGGSKILPPRTTAPTVSDRMCERAGRVGSREVEGSAAATPASLIDEAVLLLFPIFAAMSRLTFAAYHLAR
jgi:hypothetical protein